MIKKSKMILLLIFCFIMVLSGCAKDKDNMALEPQEVQESAVTPEPVVGADKAMKENEATAVEVKEEDRIEAIAETEKIEIKIGALKGPTAIGMVKVMEDASKEDTANSYQFTVAGTADEISAGLVKGDIDVAAIPCNLASVLYNKTEGQIKLAGINTLGVLYIVETGNSIQTVEDLKGKTIYSTGFGTTPQYTLNYLLNAYGINPDKDVTIEYKTEATEVAAFLSEAKEGIAMLPQPYVTTVMMSNSNVRIALDVAKEWESASEDDSSVVTGVVVVRKDFLEDNKEAFDNFLKEYKESVDYVNNNIEEASALVEKFDIFKAAVAKQAIPYCNITLIDGEEMKTKTKGYLKTLFDQNPKAVGGKLPAEDFYYLP